MLVHRPLDEAGDAGNRVPVDVAVVDLVNELLRRQEVQVLEDHRREQRHRAASVELPDNGHQCRPADPEATTFVAEQISPASGTRRATRCVAAVGN